MEIITLNLVPKGITPVCHASQFDIGRTIRLAIVDELHGYIFSDEEVELRVRKPDDNVVTASVEVTSGNAYVDIVTTEQMTACEGVNKCELRITKGGVRIGSLNFDMKVEVDPLKDGIESETEIHNLETQIAELDAIIVPPIVAEEVANQYDSENVIFDDHPTPGHGTGYVVKSENVPDELNDLDDVDISGQAQGEALVWNGAEWVNGTVSTVGSIDDLNDVDTTGKGTGDSLRFDPDAGEEGEWVAQKTVVPIDEADYEDLQEKQPCTFYAIDDGSPLDYTAEDILYEEGGTETVHDKLEEKADTATTYTKTETETKIDSNFKRAATAWGTSVTLPVDRNHFIVLASTEMYLVWFASTNTVRVRNVGANTTADGTDTVTIGGITFSRSGLRLTVTSSSSNAITIIG